MKNFAKTTTIALSMVLSACAGSSGPKTERIDGQTQPTDHVFVLMGQSNMVGVNTPDLTEPVNERIRMLNLSNQIVPASNPLFKGPTLYPELYTGSGAGPGLSFSQSLIIDLPSSDTITLVPCARGGATMSEQVKTNQTNYLGQTFTRSLLDVCLERTKLAMSSNSVFRGILLYQGESDVGNSFSIWRDGVHNIYDSFNRVFHNNPKIIFAQIAYINTPDAQVKNEWDTFKQNQYNFSVSYNIPYVQTDDSTLSDNYDHLDAASAFVVGQRFYSAFKE